MMNFQGVDIKRLAAGLPEHFAALAEDPALTKRLEIEGMNYMFNKLSACLMQQSLPTDYESYTDH